jgi:hypothetical protein
MGLSTSAVNGKIYAIGGDAPGTHISTVEEYDPAADVWTKKTNMPTARSYLSSSVVDDKIYAIGGWAANFVTAMEEYTPEWQFAVSPKDKLATTWGNAKKSRQQ